MAIKLDLKMAYDRLNEGFVCDTLVDVGFPNMIINVIMVCLPKKKMKL